MSRFVIGKLYYDKQKDQRVQFLEDYDTFVVVKKEHDLESNYYGTSPDNIVELADMSPEEIMKREG